jgi:hypothetical protein
MATERESPPRNLPEALLEFADPGDILGALLSEPATALFLLVALAALIVVVMFLGGILQEMFSGGGPPQGTGTEVESHRGCEIRAFFP